MQNVVSDGSDSALVFKMCIIIYVLNSQSLFTVINTGLLYGS